MESYLEVVRLMLGSTREKGDCWVWQGSVTTKGYAQTKLKPAEHAHRFMFRLLRGGIPEGHQLHHICGTKRCLNPIHLEVVTPIQHKERHPNGICRRCGSGLVPWETRPYGDGRRTVRRCPVCRPEQQRAAYLRQKR